MPPLSLFATCPKTIEDLLRDELHSAGAADLKETVAGVRFSAGLSTAYRLCLFSRFANRILLLLAEFPAASAEELHSGVGTIAWEQHLAVDDTFAVEGSVSGSAIRHSDYAALVVKDGIADYFRAKRGKRPSVDPRTPGLRVNLHLVHDVATVSIQLSGGSLHRRAYRVQGVAAPLKENVAAAMLARARWPEIAGEGGTFIDPMCGSGTLLIEAALMAGDVAPGLVRLLGSGEQLRSAGLTEAARGLLRGLSGGAGAGRPASQPRLPQRWLGNEAASWRAAVREAAERCAAGASRVPVILGFDRDSGAVAAARANIAQSGLSSTIAVERGELGDLMPPAAPAGLLAMNPPYGLRIGSERGTQKLYEEIGRVLHERFRGWKASILTSDLALSKSVGLRAERVNTLFNGPTRCVLSHFALTESNRFAPRAEAPAPPPSAGEHRVLRPAEEERPAEADLERRPPLRRRTPREEPPAAGPRGRVPPSQGGGGRYRATGGVLAFVNRIRKNSRLRERWARSNGISCYRIYDADLPDYAVAVDFFEGRWLHVQEYVAPLSIDEAKAAKRFEDIVTVLPQALGVAPENVFVKRRRRRKRTEQYTRLAALGEFYEVHEGGYSFLVNFTDYLDTGLFLDHRITREIIRSEAAGKRFLNLFAYTGTASVYAVKGGAVSTTSIDSSNTYLRWARENFSANGIAGQQHRLLRADCWEWLHEDRERYDLIFMDPPTFSNAKGKRATLDVQRDHAKIIRLAAERLAPGGTLLFSTNFRRFRMEEEALSELAIENITAETIPRDFARNPRIHACFCIRLRKDGTDAGIPRFER